MAIVHKQLLVAVCSAMLLLIGVTMATNDNNNNNDDNNCKKMATYNVGLINSVGQQESRLPRIIQALKQSQDDFICMQEVWLENDMTEILNAVSSEFPHHWSKIHAHKDFLRDPNESFFRRRDTPCRISDALRIANYLHQCSEEQGCTAYPEEIRGICHATRCQEASKCESIRESCISCMFFKGDLSFEDALRACVIPTKHHNRVNDPGLLILSKQPLSHVSYTEYFPGYRAAIERGFIEAELDDGKVIGCTHLTSIFPGIYLEYAYPFTNYVDQQNAEITKLGRVFAGRRHVLLGDFNVSPVVRDEAGERNLTGEYPDHYDRLMAFGYRAPYMEQDGRCTFCFNNSLTRQAFNRVIDQVLVSPPDGFSTPLAERTFDHPSDPALSDHYGTRTVVCDP